MRHMHMRMRQCCTLSKLSANEIFFPMYSKRNAMPKGCTHSRDSKTGKCRSKKEHERRMLAFRRRVSAAAEKKIKASLKAHAMGLRKKRKSAAIRKYSRLSLKTTRV